MWRSVAVQLRQILYITEAVCLTDTVEWIHSHHRRMLTPCIWTVCVCERVCVGVCVCVGGQRSRDNKQEGFSVLSLPLPSAVSHRW